MAVACSFQASGEAPFPSGPLIREENDAMARIASTQPSPWSLASRKISGTCAAACRSVQHLALCFHELKSRAGLISL